MKASGEMMNLLNPYKGLPKSVYVIFIAQIINRFGDFVNPFLVLFLTREFGYSMSKIGSIVMLTSLLAIPGSLLGGKVADHFGRKVGYILFQGIAGFSLFLCAFYYKTQFMLLFIMVSAFFNGAVRPIIRAILTDVLPDHQRQAGFSLSYLGINIGVAIGPMVAGFLFNRFLMLLFLGDAITSFIAILLVIFNIEESHPDKVKSNFEVAKEEAPVEGSIWHALFMRPKLILFLFFNIFFSATYVQSHFSLPLMMDDVFGRLGPEYYGSMISVNAVSVLVFTVALTQFSRHRAPILNIALSGVAYMVGFGMIAFINHLFMFYLATVIWTLGEILNAINFGVYVANQTPLNFRARFNAVTTLSYAVGSTLGTALMGIFIDHFGIRAVWGTTAGIALIGTLGILLVADKEKKGRDLAKNS